MADTLHKTHREKTTALQESIGNGRFEETALQYLSPFQYKQHNPTIASGQAAIFALHDQLPADTTRAHVLRAFQDGDYAFVHVDYDLGGPMVAFDIHRYQDGHAVEHWDNLQPKAATPNPSGHTMIDGATEIADLDRTHDNKLLVTRYIEDVIVAPGPNMPPTISRAIGSSSTIHTWQTAPLHSSNTCAIAPKLERVTSPCTTSSAKATLSSPSAKPS